MTLAMHESVECQLRKLAPLAPTRFPTVIASGSPQIQRRVQVVAHQAVLVVTFRRVSTTSLHGALSTVETTIYRDRFSRLQIPCNAIPSIGPNALGNVENLVFRYS